MHRTNPTTAEPLPPIDDHDDRELDQRLARAAKAFEDWRTTPLAHRSTCLHALATRLRATTDELAATMAREMGKPVTAGRTEVEKCAVACDWFATAAPAMLEPRPIPSDAHRSYLRHDPLGPVLAIMPWNFPLWQVIRFAAPALMAGNVGLLKHAPNVPECAIALERLFAEANFPDGAFLHLRTDNARAEALIRHPMIAAVTLTGSERAGIAVATAAASVLKKSVLELGGSDPFIVLPDADLAAAARSAAEARCLNTGQSCIAAKRFLIVGDDARAATFAQELAAAMQSFRVGDPMLPDTQLGPLARQDLRDALHDQVRRTIAAGATLITGGRPLPRPGFFYEPTVLLHVTPNMPAFNEETFGPLAAVTPAPTIDDALRLANRSRYGLGASLWTSDPKNAEPLTPHLDAGSVFINGIVKSDPRLPFGGIKRSGWGRELADLGLYEFTNAKSVWIAS